MKSLTLSGQFVFRTTLKNKTTKLSSLAVNKQEGKHKSNVFWIEGKVEKTLCSSGTIKLNTIKKNSILEVTFIN